jgi:hypothetical protein
MSMKQCQCGDEICDKYVVTLGYNDVVVDKETAYLIDAAADLLLAAKEAAVMLAEIAVNSNVKIELLKSPGFVRICNAVLKAEGKVFQL